MFRAARVAAFSFLHRMPVKAPDKYQDGVDRPRIFAL